VLKLLILTLFISTTMFAIEIKHVPINFSQKRINLTKTYIKKHYALDVKDIKIVPKIVLIHYTGIDDYTRSIARFKSPTLPNDRPEIADAGKVNVSAHFIIKRDGTIVQLMPLDFMARHVIGLNYSAIGIENVGGENAKENLTVEQLISNIVLIKYLKKKFNTIEYIVGHYEYRCFEKTPLWLELDDNYRTSKTDPGEIFLRDIRANLSDFKVAPCQ